MSRLRGQTKRFYQKSLESLLLALELFNRPIQKGRQDGVMIFLHHSLEMLMKAAVFSKSRNIIERSTGEAYSFDRCTRIIYSDLHCISENEKNNLTILDRVRGASYHNLLEMSEDFLYLHAQSGVTVFESLLFNSFELRLGDTIPERVLPPISMRPPQDLVILLEQEFKLIEALLEPGKRKRAEAQARLRYLLALEAGITESDDELTQRHVDRTTEDLRSGVSWRSMFPGVATLQIATEGDGPRVSVRFTREHTAAPVRLLREGEPGAEDATLVREVNLLDRYSLGLYQLAQKVGLTAPKTLALAKHINLQADLDCYREFRMGISLYKRYSQRSVERLRQALLTADMVEVWRQHRSSQGRPVGSEGVSAQATA